MLKSLFAAFRRPAGRADPPRSGRTVILEAPSWHAVSIDAGPAACARARECGTRRFLSAEAPRLPLPNCDTAVCDCRYRHHQDRRAKPRRLVDRGELRRPYAGVEQRVISRGRRASDG